ncbi:hypothetical protein IU433_14185 [Nocardia puris]|nr:hypothetical protein [Nocardia puris]MBF6460186.1 hypothetical protein [Nocardia puris]
MPDRDQERRRLQAALRTDDEQQALALLFNIDEHGHEYPADLLDLTEHP